MKPIIYLLLTSSLFALSPQQKANLKIVYDEAKKHTRYPTTIAAICLVESSAGANKNRVGDDGASYGVMQIQVKTVRWLASIKESLKWTNKLSNIDIAKLLLTHLEFSTRIACIYFEHYMSHDWGYFKSVSMYNGGVKNYRYVNKVENAKKLILKEMR
jgi:hypothetical protein